MHKQIWNIWRLTTLQMDYFQRFEYQTSLGSGSTLFSNLCAIFIFTELHLIKFQISTDSFGDVALHEQIIELVDSAIW